MGKITGGVVAIEDGTKKTEEYTPPRKVRVELRFDVAEGGDADKMLTEVGEKVNAKVAELLGMKPVAAKPAKPPSDKKPADKPKEVVTDPVQNATVTLVAKAEDDDLPGAEPSKPTAVTAEAVAEKAKDITDAELLSAVSKRNGETKNPAAIKATAAKFSKSGRVTEVPQEKRAEFMQALAEIEVKAAA